MKALASKKKTRPENGTAKVTDSVSANQLSQVGEGLYRLNADSQPVNALAKKTTISQDGKHYIIDLHQNGKWSNGHAVTAQDFVYSWRRTLNPQSKSEFTYQFANIQNGSRIFGVGKYFHSKSTRPFLITKKGI
ncbi:ABC transporter substrate-binding protein [Furfurilactobacillus milii]|uniref:ABC transporter substrate-binding protein n=1 Tax=Furfurilactobacillus milii TaxID=2888272 RepID=UPI001EE30F03|nr:ABC transporter substrate-binding protein [Furfurilactobacillus milii]